MSRPPRRAGESLTRLFQPEPSFEQRLSEIEKLYPVHPLFLPLEGGPLDSDEERRLLAVQDAAWGTSHGRQQTGPTEVELRVPTRQAGPSCLRMSGPAERRRSIVLPPAPNSGTHGVRFQVPTSASDVAMVTHHADESAEENVGSHEALSSPPEHAADIIEISSEEDKAGDDGHSRSIARGSSSRREGTLNRAGTRAGLRRRERDATHDGAGADVAEPGSRGRPAKRARLSLEQAVEQARKLSDKNLSTQFPTIASFVDHLAQFERDPSVVLRGPILQGCRIAFVNTGHWFKTSQTPNRFDKALRTNMRIAVLNGAELVKPEDFVPPPYDVEDRVGGNSSDGDVAARAEAEGWTTHIIPLDPPLGQRPATFDKILKCLGKNGISRNELGPYVKVVRFEWISQCVQARVKVDERDFVLHGDFREEARRIQEMEQLRLDELKRQAEGNERERDKGYQSKSRVSVSRGRVDAGEDTQRESDDDNEEHLDAVSPLGPDDWPDDEEPPPGYFDQPLSQSTTTTHIPKKAQNKGKEREVVSGGRREDSEAEHPSDPIESPDRTREYRSDATTHDAPSPGTSPFQNSSSTQVYQGLEEENEIINTIGAANVDKVIGGTSALDLFERDPNSASSMRKTHDNETEDENSDDEPSEEVGVNPKKGRPALGWACENPEKTREQRRGPNESTAKTLEHLAQLIPKVVDKDEFRIRSHQRVAEIVRNHPQHLTDYDEIIQIPGIGDKMARKIVEIARTGTHRRLSMYETDADKAQKLFGDLYGVTKGAQDLYARGARSIEDLRRDPRRYGVTKPAILLGLKYYEDLMERIPRAEVTELVEIVKKLAREIDPKLQVDCLGSYCRGAESSGDIDLLVTRDPSDGRTHEGLVKKLWERMKRAGVAQHELSLPSDPDSLDAKILGLCKIPHKNAKMRRIDVLGVPWQEMPAATIYFSSGTHFNRSLRLKARRLGYRLNQRGLYKDVAFDGKGAAKLSEGALVKGIRTEQDIFRLLDVPWRPPEDRKM